MESIIFSEKERETRRKFMKKSMFGVSAAFLGGLMSHGCTTKQRTVAPSPRRSIALGRSQRPLEKNDKSCLSFITGSDTRDAAYKSLNPSLPPTIYKFNKNNIRHFFMVTTD